MPYSDGFAIILLTCVVVKAVTFPLSRSSTKIQKPSPGPGGG